MPKHRATSSDLICNREGKLSDNQRSRIIIGLIVRGLSGLFPLGLFALTLLAIILISTKPSWDKGVLIFLAVLAVWSWLWGVPSLRHAARLASDLRGKTTVSEDCGVLTFEVYRGTGRGSVRMSYINIDNERRYLWNSQITGGFENKDFGCIYFARHSKLVLSIETFTKEQIETF